MDNNYWQSILDTLNAEINASQASTGPMADRFTNTTRDRLNLVQNLQGAGSNPAWLAELDNLLNASFQQHDRGIQRNHAAGTGMQVANQGGRGLLGSSFDAQGRAGLQAAREGSRQQLAQSTEQARAGAVRGREGEVADLVQAILSDDGNLGAAGQQLIGGLANSGQAAAANASLDADMMNSNSQMWGNIFTNLGQAGASGIRWADRENQGNWNWNRTNPGQPQRRTDNSWFGGW